MRAAAVGLVGWFSGECKMKRRAPVREWATSCSSNKLRLVLSAWWWWRPSSGSQSLYVRLNLLLLLAAPPVQSTSFRRTRTAARSSDTSISLFQFRYDIDIDIMYVTKIHILFADLNFNGQDLIMCILTDRWKAIRATYVYTCMWNYCFLKFRQVDSNANFHYFSRWKIQ